MVSFDYQTLFGENASEIESLLGSYGEVLMPILAFLGGFILVLFLITLVVLILVIVATCKMYIKAGKKGWQAIIPYYNSYVLTEIAGLNWWWFLILIASSIVSIIFGKDILGLTTLANIASFFGWFVCCFNIAKKLHKETGFAILLAIFPVIVIPIIAFSKNYQFDNEVTVSKNGIF